MEDPFTGLRSVLDDERFLWDISTRNQIAKIKSFLGAVREVHYKINDDTNEIDQIAISAGGHTEEIPWIKKPGENCTIKTTKSHEMKEEDWRWLLERIVEYNSVPLTTTNDNLGYYKM